MAPLNLTPANIELFLARAKPFLLVWLVIRVFSSGLLGKTATAAAAAGLALACRAMPALVPARAAEQLKKIDTLSASSNQRLLLSLSVDAVGAFLALFEPRWLRMIVGGAGWAPVSTFVIQYVYSLIPVTAVAALEESGILPRFLRITPTATIAWVLKEGISSPRGLWAAVKAAANGVGIKI